MEDISQACELVTRMAGEIGMREEDRRKTNELLERYGDERNELMEDMVELLAKSDSDVRDDWEDLCEKGDDLLERLDRDIPRSPSGEGLAGVGLKDFAEGEKKIWEQNAKAEIAFVADVIAKIHRADVELIKKCEEDLRTVRDGDKVVEALVQQTLGGVKKDIGDFLKLLVSKRGHTVFSVWVKDASAKDYVKGLFRMFVKSLDDTYQAAKQKRVLKEKLLDDIELLRKTKEQLSEEWIAAMYGKGEEFAKSLYDAGENGSYEAEDWKRFGEACRRPLADSRDRAKEQSKKLFGELLPTFIDENARAFAALTDDPSKVDSWMSELTGDFESIEDVLDAEEELIEELADGPFKQAALEALNEMKQLVGTGLKLLVSKTKDSDDEIKK